MATKVLTLTDGTQIVLLGYMRLKEYFWDAMRDAIEFRVDASVLALAEADVLFTAENCQTLTIQDGDNESITLRGYTVRMEVARREVKEKVDDEAVFSSNIVVKMGVPSEAEELNRAMDELLLEVLGV